ncbi:hypothetical protein PFISCL1PPCAC_27678, partial [Pristionchus fissidentatus]
SSQGAVRGVVDCNTSTGRRAVPNLKMRFMLWNVFRANEELMVASTDSSGKYYLEGAKDEWGKTI